ncbi:hypothetical protein [Kitasatospora sp. NPDC057015]|uniref:hypothetical protein n=1 Tax=Kitasatospora sp. NPDC057015 TaxID=3346001 RepID=UPI00362772E1
MQALAHRHADKRVVLRLRGSELEVTGYSAKDVDRVLAQAARISEDNERRTQEWRARIRP